LELACLSGPGLNQDNPTNKGLSFGLVACAFDKIFSSQTTDCSNLMREMKARSIPELICMVDKLNLTPQKPHNS